MRGHPATRRSDNGRLWSVPRTVSKSVRFRARKLNHSGPLLGLAREKLGEIGGRAGQRRAAQLGNPRLHLGIDKGGIEFLIKPLDNGGGRAGRGRGARPTARPRRLPEIRHGWKPPPGPRTPARRYAKGGQ